MKKNPILVLAVGLLVTATVACGTTSSTATPNTQATVDAAVAATTAAQDNTRATIDAAVQATTAAVEATATAAPTPTPSAEYVTMTEEELAALIDQAVTEATAAAQECSTATAETTADGTVTPEEVETVAAYTADVEEAIAYADELIYAYYDLYGELATETLVLLQAIEQDLAVMAEEIAAVNTALLEIATDLEQGLALAEETIAQLEDAAQAARAVAGELQPQVQDWVATLQAELEDRAATALAVQPDNVPADRQAALQAAFDYVDGVRQALDDDRISQAELASIAQLGANASAGLNDHGGPRLQELSGSIGDITGQVARGEAVRARDNLGSLEASLGTRPSRR